MRLDRAQEAGTTGTPAAGAQATVHLQYDARLAYGSPEHFFHYLWGYLLPSLHLILQTAREQTTYVVSSCGPVMDAVTRNLMELCGVDYAIAEQELIEGATLRVPRWDVALLQRLLVAPEDGQYSHLEVLRRQLHSTELIQAYTRPAFEQDLLAAITAVVTYITACVDRSLDERPSAPPQPTYLLLARSAEPAFYGQEGGAAVAGYGTSRRGLTGLHDASAALAQWGINAMVFEPGGCSLIQQIQAFRSCAGIVAIKGAELGNLAWLAPGSRVVVARPARMRTPPVQRCLADLLGLPYYEFVVDGNFPRLDPDVVAEFLS